VSRVAIYAASYADCQQAVRKAFEDFPLDVAGKRVLVKPNVLRRAEPEEGITTHPAVLQAVLRELEERGAGEIIVGDNPGGGGENREAFEASGLLAVAGRYYRNIGSDVREVPFSPRFGGKVVVSTAVLEADVVLSLPKLKTHGLTGLTCAIKNCYGYIPGRQKADLHVRAGNPYAFAEMLVDVFSIRVPDLYIVDAVLAMEGNGPVSRELRYVGRLLAARDGVALDRVVGEMMGIGYDMLRSVELAAERGLGVGDLDRIELLGDLQSLEGWRLPERFATEDPSALRAAMRTAHKRKLFLPKVDPARCSLCGNCVAECPAAALTMAEYPEVRPKACVTCYCCQELCPEKAIQLTEV